MTAGKTPGLVLLASYPKSGNTWVRALFTALRREDHDVDLDRLEGSMITSVHPLVCPFPFNRLAPHEQELWHADACRSLRRDPRSITFLKTHLALRDDRYGACIFPSEIVRGAIHIVRHPFDVVPSLANHLGIDIPEAVEVLLRDDHSSGGGFGATIPEFWGSWSQHTQSWLDGSTSFPILLVRYEDLKRDPVDQLRRMTEFVGFPSLPLDSLAKAVENATFDRLREQENEHGFKERSTKGTKFFRGGRSGDGWKALEPAQRARIAKACSDAMERLGYDPEAPR